MLCVYPTFFLDRAPKDAAEQTWPDLRPPDEENWRRVRELESRRGFWATARLVALHGKPGEEALLAIALERVSDT